MEQYHNTISNSNSDRKKIAIESKIYSRFITTIAIPAVLLILTFMASAPISPVQATVGGGGDETAATPAPGGASLGPTANETNVTAAQSACLPQNATTTGGRPAVDAGAATATTTDNTTATTVAPSGASIGGNETSTSSLAATGNTTAGNTTATVAPSGASIC